MAIERLGRKRFPAIMALIVLSFVCLSLTLASSADAQQPAFCEQYPNDPACIAPGGGGGDNPDGDDDTGPGAFSGGTGDGDGSLPFTGYPLTSLVLLFLVLLLLGLTVRATASIRDRLGRAHTQS